MLMTNFVSVFAELVIGYVLPGKPIAMMMFKTWGYNTMYQAIAFTSDLKLGHYMKIACVSSSTSVESLRSLQYASPRPMFFAQVMASIIGGTVQLAVQAWMFAHIPDMCSPTQPDGFIVSFEFISLHCRQTQGFFLRSARRPRFLVPHRSSGELLDPRASSRRDRCTSEHSSRASDASQ